MLEQILRFLLDTLFGFFVFVLLARFYLQLLRAPFRNPLGQFVTAMTNWLVLPARRLIPGMFGLDLASFLLAWLIEALLLFLLFALKTGSVGGASGLLVGILFSLALFELARFSLYLLIGVILIQAVISWVNPYAPLAPLFNALTGPFLRPFRRLIPPVGNIDLSPLFALVAAQLLLIPLEYLARSVALLLLSWYQLGRDGLTIQIQAQPGAKRTEVAGLYGECIKVRLASPPVDGKANACLIEFLARRLGVKRGQISIARGASSRRKRVFVAATGLEPAVLLEKEAGG